MIVVPDPLSLYCDASGNEREPLTVVGGAIATVQDWIAFASRWNTALARDGIEYFRASEFARSRGQFRNGWEKNASRRDALVNRLLDAMDGVVKWWFAVAVRQSEFDKVDLIYELHENFQPFALAGETCIDWAFRWREAQRYDYLPLQCFFESGDRHWGQMSDRIQERFGEAPIPGNKNAPPFQLADFVAYEVRTAFVDLEVNKEKLFKKFGHRFLLLGGRIQGSWGELTDLSIRTELRRRKIPRRSA